MSSIKNHDSYVEGCRAIFSVELRQGNVNRTEQLRERLCRAGVSDEEIFSGITQTDFDCGRAAILNKVDVGDGCGKSACWGSFAESFRANALLDKTEIVYEKIRSSLQGPKAESNGELAWVPNKKGSKTVEDPLLNKEQLGLFFGIEAEKIEKITTVPDSVCVKVSFTSEVDMLQVKAILGKNDLSKFLIMPNSVYCLDPDKLRTAIAAMDKKSC